MHRLEFQRRPTVRTTGTERHFFHPAACQYDPCVNAEFMGNSLMKDSMRTWRQACNDGPVSGATGSLASTVAISIAGLKKTGLTLGLVNVINRWIWRDRTRKRHEASLDRKGAGYAILHASATLWAIVDKKLCKKPQQSLPARQVMAQAGRQCPASPTTSQRPAARSPTMKNICQRLRPPCYMGMSDPCWQQAAHRRGVDWTD